MTGRTSGDQLAASAPGPRRKNRLLGRTGAPWQVISAYTLVGILAVRLPIVMAALALAAVAALIRILFIPSRRRLLPTGIQILAIGIGCALVWALWDTFTSPPDISIWLAPIWWLRAAVTVALPLVAAVLLGTSAARRHASGANEPEPAVERPSQASRPPVIRVVQVLLASAAALFAAWVIAEHAIVVQGTAAAPVIDVHVPSRLSIIVVATAAAATSILLIGTRRRWARIALLTVAIWSMTQVVLGLALIVHDVTPETWESTTVTVVDLTRAGLGVAAWLPLAAMLPLLLRSDTNEWCDGTTGTSSRRRRSPHESD